MKGIRVSIVLLLPVVLVACSGETDIKEKFVDECTSVSGLSERICECSFNKLQNQYGVQGFREILISGQVPKGYMDFSMRAAFSCVSR